MTTLAWRVAWMVSATAAVETREDYLSLGAANARVESLRQEGRPVIDPYRIDLEEAPAS